MYSLILLSITIETAVSEIWPGKAFVLYLFIAFAEFATLMIASKLSHEYKGILKSILFYSIIIHMSWSVVSFLALSLVNGSVILWDIGYDKIYPTMYDLLKNCAFIITVLELLTLFAPTLSRLANGFFRNCTTGYTDSNGYFANSKSKYLKARSRGFKEGKG